MRIVIAGNYGANNIGDELILEGLIAQIRSVKPKSEITVLSANSAETQTLHKVKSVKPFPAGPRSLIKWIFTSNKDTKNALRECDLFILGGGGLFGDLTLKANLIWGIQAFMAYRYKKNVAMLGQSIGPLKGKMRQFIVRYLFKRASTISVRDKKSAKRLKKLNIKNEILILPDFAFSLKAPNATTREKSILVCLRQMSSLNAEFKQDIAEFLDEVQEKHSYRVEFLSFQQPDDDQLHQEIFDLMFNRKGVNFIKQPRTSEDLLNAFAKSGLALTMRLHSAITAIKTETPFIAISYASKLKDLLETHHLLEYSTDLDRISVEGLLRKFKTIEKDYIAIQNKLVKINNEIAKQNSQQIFSRILR